MTRQRYANAVAIFAGAVLIVVMILYPFYLGVVRIWEWVMG